MNQEQRNIMASLIEQLLDSNKAMLETLERLRPSDQREYLPKIKKHIDETALLNAVAVNKK